MRLSGNSRVHIQVDGGNAATAPAQDGHSKMAPRWLPQGVGLQFFLLVSVNLFFLCILVCLIILSIHLCFLFFYSILVRFKPAAPTTTTNSSHDSIPGNKHGCHSDSDSDSGSAHAQDALAAQHITTLFSEWCCGNRENSSEKKNIKKISMDNFIS